MQALNNKYTIRCLRLEDAGAEPLQNICANAKSVVLLLCLITGSWAPEAHLPNAQDCTLVSGRNRGFLQGCLSPKTAQLLKTSLPCLLSRKLMREIRSQGMQPKAPPGGVPFLLIFSGPVFSQTAKFTKPAMATLSPAAVWALSGGVRCPVAICA